MDGRVHLLRIGRLNLSLNTDFPGACSYVTSSGEGGVGERGIRENVIESERELKGGIKATETGWKGIEWSEVEGKDEKNK